jgi:hypothetical protein
MNPSAFKAPAVIVIALVLVAETPVLLGLSAFLTYQLAVDTLDSLASAVGLVVITVISRAWIAGDDWGWRSVRTAVASYLSRSDRILFIAPDRWFTIPCDLDNVPARLHRISIRHGEHPSSEPSRLAISGVT